MASETQRNKLTTILMGVASCILGVFMFMNPESIAVLATTIVGIVLIVIGVLGIIGYFRDKSSQVDLVINVIEVVFGVLIAAMPGTFVSWVVIVIGVLILMMGLSDFSESRIAMRLATPFASAKFVMAIVTIVCGIVVIISPFAFVDFAFTIAGLGLVINGVTEILAGIKE